MFQLRKLSNLRKLSYDYIVCGCGSAGSVVARRLYEKDKNANILVVDVGKEINWLKDAWKFHIPIGISNAITSPKHTTYYESLPQTNLNDRIITYPRGMILGGCSQINGMVHLRAHPFDLDEWSKRIADDSWSYENCVKYFKKSETILNEKCDYNERGSSGPLYLSKGPLTRNRYGDLFLESCKNNGKIFLPDINSYSSNGYGYFDTAINEGVRRSLAFDYLFPIRRNISILQNVKCHRMILDENNKRCNSIELTYPNSPTSFRVKGENIIICLGSIESPLFLERSGIGRKDVIENSLKIPLKKRLENVGENVQDHFAVQLKYRMRRIKSKLMRMSYSNWRKSASIFRWLINGDGFSASNHMEMGAFINSSQTKQRNDRSDIQIHFLPAMLRDNETSFYKIDGFQLYSNLTKPTSVGSIHSDNRSNSLLPLINPNYLSTQYDQWMTLEAIRQARLICHESPLRDEIKDEFFPGFQYQNDNDLYKYIRETGGTVHHLSSSCRMGIDESDSVVNSSGFLHGIENVQIIDASIMPSITSTNLNATVVMMAEKLIDGRK